MAAPHQISTFIDSLRRQVAEVLANVTLSPAERAKVDAIFTQAAADMPVVPGWNVQTGRPYPDPSRTYPGDQHPGYGGPAFDPVNPSVPTGQSNQPTPDPDEVRPSHQPVVPVKPVEPEDEFDRIDHDRVERDRH